jgi:LL-diaminopimelate aminotransferase
MATINEHYLKLKAGYLFPEIARRVEQYRTAHPDHAQRVISCGIGDVTEPIPRAALLAMHEAVDELSSRETFHGYGPPTGYSFLRDAIVEHDFKALGIEISADEVFISDGSKGDCGAVLEILGLGNRIGITDPVYPVYVDANVMAGHTGPADAAGCFAGLTYLPCVEEHSFVAQIPDAPLDVVYLCFPNNPTGAMIDRAQLEQWVAYALKHEAIILYDVAYQAYIADDALPRSIYEIDGAKKCAMEFHSFSKNGGFTGVRCGYTVCPHELEGSTSSGERIALNRLWNRRWATRSNGVSWPVQRGAAALYSAEGAKQVRTLIEHYLGNATLLRQGCEALGLNVFGGVHAPYVWVQCPQGFTSWQWFDVMLEQSNIVITPGSGFGSCGEGYFRISAFNTRANVEEVVRRMGAVSTQPV